MVPRETPSRTRVKGISLITLGLSIILVLIFVTNTIRIQKETKLADGYRRRVHVQPSHSRIKEWGSPLYGMNHVIFFNAIPKTGCRSIARAATFLIAKRQHSTEFNAAIIPENILFNERKLRQFVGSLPPPAIVGGHAAFVPFPRGSPVRYVNVLRDPVERLVSNYYFELNGDLVNVNFPNMAPSDDKLSLDECLLDSECKRTRYDKLLWTTISQLCGTGPVCGTLSRKAMLKAKSNLNNYAMIGLTEDLNTTVLLLEKTFPTMMNGLHLEFRRSEKGSLTKFKTTGKMAPSPETVKILQRDLALEYEIYDEVKRRFHDLKAKMEL